jgi:hypothetical protein
LRCRAEGRGSVVVKAYADGPDALGAFTAEASGLSLGLAGPELLAVDARHPLLVMADLGHAPTLADVLLGDDAGAARDGLLAWARGLGRLAAASVGGREELAALRARYDKGHAGWAEDTSMLDRFAALPAELEAAGIAPPAGLVDDLDALGALVGDGYAGFTPGDTCSDNNLLTPSGLRLLDFEGAAYHSVFLTAAYCRMPFATCWCVFRMPPGLAEEAEEAFRGEVLPVYPDLADDAVWHAGLRRAMAAWTVMMMFLLPDATAEDRPMNRTRRPVPTMRQLLTYRWEVLHAELTAAGELKALAETMRILLQGVGQEWGTEPLPGYPAFGALRG